MKTLEQVEARTPLDPARVIGDDAAHFVISQTGSYYLTGNIDVSKTYGIRVAAAGVTIDLNGFTIRRTEGSEGEGIRIESGSHRTTVKNGSITGFGYGIRPFNISATRGGSYQHLSVSQCSVFALAGAEAWQVEGCRVFDNAGDGLSVGSDSTIKDCVASKNAGGNGIEAASRNTITRCASYDNAGNGIVAGPYSTISHCTASSNKGNVGIFAGGGSEVSHCTASDNTVVYGIQVGGGSLVSHCVARANVESLAASYGISAGSGSTVVSCSATGNTNTSGAPNGLSGVGIHANARSTIRDCTAGNNKGDGIRVESESYVVGNHSLRNGDGGNGAGIHVIPGGTDNRIEGNNATDNDHGLLIEGPENLITKNSAAANLVRNYEIVAGNRYGTIFDGSVASGAAVSGSGTNASTVSSDPWANVSY